jgi:gentisate 1,2-dioxygenase
MTGTTDSLTVAKSTPDTAYTRRARYFDSGNAFNVTNPPVPGTVFETERDQAMAQDGATELIPLDQSAAMGLTHPATTPLVLAAYGRIRKGESLLHDPEASTLLGYVIAGEGRSLQGEDTIEWATGDAFALPGHAPVRHEAGATDCVLWLVSNAPQLAQEHFRPPSSEQALVQAVHFPADEIARQLEIAEAKLKDQLVAGLAVVLATERLEDVKNVSPSLTLAMNQLPPGGAQTAHRHNSVAVSLVVDGAGGYSMVDGERKDWSPWLTSVTPPEAVHSHHNESGRSVRWLIVQDGGLYYHCRTMGFRFE